MSATASERPVVRLLRQLVRFGLVGAFNTASYVAIYSALVYAGVPYALSSILAFPVPVAIGYWLHEHWTFERRQPSPRGLFAWLLTQLVALLATTGLLIIAVEGLGADPILARIALLPLSPVGTFLAGKFWIFPMVR